MNNKWKRCTVIATASTLTLAGCGSSVVEQPLMEQSQQTELQDDDLMSIKDSEFFKSCDEWKESDDGSFECIDEDSPLYAQHFFNGLMFATIGAMVGSSLYKSLNKKDGTERQQVINSGGGGGSSSTSSSGIVSSPNNNKSTTTDGNAGNKSGVSDGNTSKSTNGNVSNGSSNGKSGFGSGGSARGGSSSS